MKKQNALKQKLKCYTMLSSSLLASAVAADAQVIYTDVNPDFQSGSNNDITVDLNGDGTADYYLATNFYAFNSYLSGSVYVGNLGNKLGVDSLSSLPLAMDSGELIGSNLIWGNEDLLVRIKVTTTFSTFASQGNWINTYNNFLPLKFNIDGEQHYGWVRLGIGFALWGFTLKDYAYELIPDSAITAGAFITGIGDENVINDIHVFPTPAKDFLNIQVSPSLAVQTIRLINVCGQEVQSLNVGQSRRGDFLLSIDDVSPGIYILLLQLKEGTVSKKILVVK